MLPTTALTDFRTALVFLPCTGTGTPPHRVSLAPVPPWLANRVCSSKSNCAPHSGLALLPSMATVLAARNTAARPRSNAVVSAKKARGLGLRNITNLTSRGRASSSKKKRTTRTVPSSSATCAVNKALVFADASMPPVTTDGPTDPLHDDLRDVTDCFVDVEFGSDDDMDVDMGTDVVSPKGGDSRNHDARAFEPHARAGSDLNASVGSVTGLVPSSELIQPSPFQCRPAWSSVTIPAEVQAELDRLRAENEELRDIVEQHAPKHLQISAEVYSVHNHIVTPMRLDRSLSVHTQAVLRSQKQRPKPGALAQNMVSLLSRRQGFEKYVASMSFATDIVNLARLATKVMSKEERLLSLPSPVYIFGDIHGNLKDLHFFSDNLWKFGVMLTAGRFLFLGDYVDRGQQSLEVVAYLFALKVVAPEKVFLLRGNHELRKVNGWEEWYKSGSFLWQCKHRFGADAGAKVWEEVNRAFDCMPLAAIVDNSIFCCHGGIPRPLPGMTHSPPKSRTLRTPVAPRSSRSSRSSRRQSSSRHTHSSRRASLGGVDADSDGDDDGADDADGASARAPPSSPPGNGGGAHLLHLTAPDSSSSTASSAAAAAAARRVSLLETPRAGRPSRRHHDRRLDAIRAVPCPIRLDAVHQDTVTHAATVGTSSDTHQHPHPHPHPHHRQDAASVEYGDRAGNPRRRGRRESGRHSSGSSGSGGSRRRRRSSVGPAAAMTPGSRAAWAAEELTPELVQQVALDMLWADPAADESEGQLGPDGFGPGLRGGDTVQYGNTAIEEFLDGNGLQLIVRAHQAITTGIGICKSARVFTVFSTSKDHGCGATATCGCLLVENGRVLPIMRAPKAARSHRHSNSSTSTSSSSHRSSSSSSHRSAASTSTSAVSTHGAVQSGGVATTHARRHTAGISSTETGAADEGRPELGPQPGATAEERARLLAQSSHHTQHKHHSHRHVTSTAHAHAHADAAAAAAALSSSQQPPGIPRPHHLSSTTSSRRHSAGSSHGRVTRGSSGASSSSSNNGSNSGSGTSSASLSSAPRRLSRSGTVMGHRVRHAPTSSMR